MQIWKQFSLKFRVVLWSVCDPCSLFMGHPFFPVLSAFKDIQFPNLLSQRKELASPLANLEKSSLNFSSSSFAELFYQKGNKEKYINFEAHMYRYCISCL